MNLKKYIYIYIISVEFSLHLSHTISSFLFGIIITFVACVRRRADRPPPSSSGVVCLSILENMVRQGIRCLLAVKDGMGVAT